MAIADVQLWELRESRGLSQDKMDATDTLKFVATGSGSEAEVRAALLVGDPDATPDPILPLLSIVHPEFTALVLRGMTIAEKGGNAFEITATYKLPDAIEYTDPQIGDVAVPPGTPPASPPPPPPADDAALGPEYSFDTSGATEHILMSYGQVSRVAAPGKVAPLFDNMIGVNKDTVEGCDKVSSKLEITTTRRFKQLSLKYIRKIRDLTGTINFDPFLGFAQGELLFLGASGQYPGPDGWTVTYRFLTGKTERMFPGGGGITVPLKRAHDVLWALYVDELDTVANKMVKRIRAIYVEAIYAYGDFTTLKL